MLDYNAIQLKYDLRPSEVTDLKKIISDLKAENLTNDMLIMDRSVDYYFYDVTSIISDAWFTYYHPELLHLLKDEEDWMLCLSRDNQDNYIIELIECDFLKADKKKVVDYFNKHFDSFEWYIINSDLESITNETV